MRHAAGEGLIEGVLEILGAFSVVCSFFLIIFSIGDTHSSPGLVAERCALPGQCRINQSFHLLILHSAWARDLKTSFILHGRIYRCTNDSIFSELSISLPNV
jgi:hypothetical protein